MPQAGPDRHFPYLEVEAGPGKGLTRGDVSGGIETMVDYRGDTKSKADALHLSTHVYTSAGVGISLAVIYFTGWYFLDPIAAIVVASYILKEAFEILIEAFRPLADAALPDKEIEAIDNTIRKNIGKGIDYHMLRTRKTGSDREVDFHLEVPGDMSVADSHNLCDKIEEHLHQKLPNLKVTIHVEPEGYHG